LEPGGEKVRRPALGFENLNGEPRVVIDGVNYNLLRAHLEQGGLGVGNEVVSQLQKGRNELVNGSRKVEQEDFAELAGAGLLHLTGIVVVDNLSPCQNNMRPTFIVKEEKEKKNQEKLTELMTSRVRVIPCGLDRKPLGSMEM